MTTYTLYRPDETVQMIHAPDDARALALARRILRTRGKWTFLCDPPSPDERVVEGWNLDPPSYGERSRTALLTAPYDRREEARSRMAAALDYADADIE